MKLKNIVFEKGSYWVLKVKHGFEIYKQVAAHSVRCAQIGYEGEEGLARAIKEIERRETKL